MMTGDMCESHSHVFPFHLTHVIFGAGLWDARAPFWASSGSFCWSGLFGARALVHSLVHSFDVFNSPCRSSISVRFRCCQFPLAFCWTRIFAIWVASSADQSAALKTYVEEWMTVPQDLFQLQ